MDVHFFRLGLFHDLSLSWEDDDALNFDPKETLRLFVGYTEHMIMFALREDSDHPLIQHAAATFYEIVRQYDSMPDPLYYCETSDAKDLTNNSQYN